MKIEIGLNKNYKRKEGSLDQFINNLVDNLDIKIKK